MDTIKIDKKDVKMIAHRGLSGIELMNTCPAFVAAGNRDYFGIETDVHKTSDGKFVVIHDDTTKRVCDTVVTVEETDFDTLRALALKDGSGKERCDLKIPSLEEYLDICACYDKVAVLELKNAFDFEQVSQIVKIAKEHIAQDRIIYISFDYQNLCYIRELLPKACIQFLCGHMEVVQIDEAFVQKLKMYNMDLDIYYKSLDKQSVDFLHQNGIRINCWTVDDADTAQALVEMGVDFITTNILQ